MRQIAQAASVTPALAHDYFTDRVGLLDAVANELAQPLLAPLLAALNGRTPQPGAALTQFVQQFTRLCIRTHWLPAALQLDTRAAGTQRQLLRSALQTMIRRAQGAQQLREDLPAAYVANAILALCTFPFIQDGADETVQLLEHGNATELTLQHIALLQNGLAHRAVRSGGDPIRGT
jgi:AcrR family transcriptional regulator